MKKPESSIADPALVELGRARIAWAQTQMPVLGSVRDRFVEQQPLAGIRIAACLHVTAETANLMITLAAGGAELSLAAANPFSTQDEVAAALVADHAICVRAVRGESPADRELNIDALVAAKPQITLDDGADLLALMHAEGSADGLLGATEETTTGLVRIRALEAAGGLRCPVIAVNEARTERAFNDRYGTGQSALDGILRATNILLAGQTVVVIGYGWAGKGVALRAAGAGATVIVCEVDPLRALEARMDGFEVLPSVEAAAKGDLFITVTGGVAALTAVHFEVMKSGAILANAGHFDVEIDLQELARVGGEPVEVRPLVSRFKVADRAIDLVAGGRVVNLAAAEGHPAAVMDMSFATQALAVAEIARAGSDTKPAVRAVASAIDDEVARLKLESMGVRIDVLTERQSAYLHSWHPSSDS